MRPRMPHLPSRLGLVCLLCLACLFCLAHPARRLAAGEATSPFGDNGFRFGYTTSLLSEVSRADAEAAMTLWSRELLRIGGYSVSADLTVYDDLPSFVSAIRNNEIDFIALSSLEFLKIRDQVPMEPALFGDRDGKPGDEHMVIVRADSGVRGLNQLRGARLTRVSGANGDIGALWIDSLLAKQGLPSSQRHFGSVKEFMKGQQAILSVFFRQADACLVGKIAYDMAVELNPRLGKELAVLAVSPVYPVAVTCFRKALTRAQKDEFVRLAFGMQDTPAGKQILTLFKINRLSRNYQGAFDPLIELVRESEGRKSAKKRVPE
ncbi:MAG: PhnD/SsuA/transferrin family substrate-binding protein [Thermodesulfobacteriota bacterium]